jgi:SAM-dependent methyltransferase
MIKKESKKKLMKLNMGCGHDIKKGFVNLDFVNYDRKVDVIHNLEKFPYPFKDNTFDYVYVHHNLEHFTDTVRILNEIHRISKKNSIIEIHVPHFACNTASTHLTHKKLFGYRTFDDLYTRNEIYTDNKFKVIYKRLVWTTSRNQVIRLFGIIVDFLSNMFPMFYERIWCYWVGGSEEIIFKLKVIK